MLHESVKWNLRFEFDSKILEKNPDPVKLRFSCLFHPYAGIRVEFIWVGFQNLFFISLSYCENDRLNCQLIWLFLTFIHRGIFLDSKRVIEIKDEWSKRHLPY